MFMTHSTQIEKERIRGKKQKNNYRMFIEYILIRSQTNSTQRGRMRKQKKKTTGCTSSSSSCRPTSTDIPDFLSPLLPIIHRFWQVFRATSRILAQLLYVRAGLPAFAWPYPGVHSSTLLMSSSLLLQEYPACLVRLTWIVFVMGGRWPNSWCLEGCFRQDLFNIARTIVV